MKSCLNAKCSKFHSTSTGKLKEVGMLMTFTKTSTDRKKKDNSFKVLVKDSFCWKKKKKSQQKDVSF